MKKMRPVSYTRGFLFAATYCISRLDMNSLVFFQLQAPSRVSCPSSQQPLALETPSNAAITSKFVFVYCQVSTNS